MEINDINALKIFNESKVNNNSIAIVGWHESCAGEVHSWFEETKEYQTICFINPSDDPVRVNPKKIIREVSNFSYPTKNTFKKLPLINSLKWSEILKEKGINKVLITTSDSQKRFEQIKYAKENNFKLINAIHSKATIMPNSILKDNIIIWPNVVIGYKSELYSGTFIKAGSLIDHHNVIKECVTINCGSVLSGNVILEKFSILHPGVTIKNKVKIGASSVVGIGSVVINNVEDNMTVFGNPSRIIAKSNVS